jgi:hypothetical protein
MDKGINHNDFTQEQIDYVSSIKNEDLRSNLLHQIRLRDSMESDRDNFEKINNNLIEKIKKSNEEKSNFTLFQTLEFIEQSKIYTLGKYAHPFHTPDGHEFAGSSIPMLMTDKATIEGLENMYKGLDFSTVKLVKKKFINL